MVDTMLGVQWTKINPNLKGELSNDSGLGIADPFLVLRCGLAPSTELQSFNIFTPAISGRLERAVFIPDHNNPPGKADVYDVQIFQHYIEAPKIDALDVPLDDTLDILNMLGIGLPDDEITHMSAWGTPPYPGTVLTPLLPHLLIQDKLRIYFSNWNEDGSGVTQNILFFYLYFSTGSPISQPMVIL